MHTIVIDDRHSAPARRLADEVIAVDRYDVQRIMEIVGSLDVDAVVSGGSDRAVWIMAQAADVCGVAPYVDENVARLPMNKDAMRAYLVSAGLPAPRSIKTAELESARAAASSLGYPIVVKPVDGIGQLGVNRVDSESELSAAFHSACESSGSGSALVQEFAKGEELGVNGFVIDGTFRLLTVAYRRAASGSGDAFGVALKKRYPAEPARPYHDHIETLLNAACQGLGLENAPIYAQVMFDKRAAAPIRIIELMPRLGGGEDPRLVLAATGFNIAKATVLAALRQPIDDARVVESQPNPAVTLLFLTATPGRIASVSGLTDARRCEGIRSADVFFDVGHELPPLRSSRERVGYVLAVGRSPSEADHRADEAAAKIRIGCE